MAQKWNLQDIRPPQPRKKRTPPQERKMEVSSASAALRPAPEPVPTEREHIPSIIIEDGRKKDRGRLTVYIILFVVIVGGAITLSALMGKTELTVYPEHNTPTISAEFTAYPDRRDGELSYEVMTLEATGESQVKATGQIEVEELATGVITIQKSTPGAERLKKNTRFRTPDGLVFKITESAVVPGAVKDESGHLVAGKIQADVYADDVGEEYNIAAGQTFDVPGFEEGGYTELYNAITATNETAFSGGFKGPQFQIDEQELQTARQALQIELRDNLLLRVDNERPADFIAFPNAVAVTYNELPAVEYSGELVTIREQAILQIPLFKATELGSYLAKETVVTYDGGTVRIDDPTVLTFSYTGATTSSSVIANEPSLTFKLTGKPLLVWTYDAEKLTKDLAGLPKTALSNAIPAYSGIDQARVHMTPFWQRTFPENPEEITVIEELKTPTDE